MLWQNDILKNHHIAFILDILIHCNSRPSGGQKQSAAAR